MDRGDCGQLSVSTMKVNQRTNVYVTEAVAVSDHKGLIIDPLLKTKYSTACHSVKARVDDPDPPVNAIRIYYFATTILQVKKIVTAVDKVIMEVLFDHFSLVPTGHKETL